MKALMTEQFIESIPNGNVERVLAKITQFCEEYTHRNYDISKMSLGYSVREIQGRQNKQRVFKFRMNKGDRIIFTFANKVLRETFEDSIIFLQYVHHDKQARLGRQMRTDETALIEVTEKELEQFDYQLDLMYQNYEYDPNQVITRVISTTQLKQDETLHEKAVYYLNDEQFDCLQTNDKPVFILGSAGSGKTTINVHKAFVLSKQPKKIGYFTYSKYLVEDAKKLFYQIEQEYDEPLSDEARKRVEFHHLLDYLQSESHHPTYMTSHEFLKWVSTSHPQKLKQMNVTPYEVYKEIRGLLKGLIPKDWITLSIDETKTPISESAKAELMKRRYLVYTTQGEYQLNTTLIYEAKSRYMDQYDSQAVVLWHYYLNEYLILHPYLTKEIYLRLDAQYCTYSRQVRELMYDILVSYEVHLQQIQKVDENDVSRQVLARVMSNDLALFDDVLVDEVQDLTELEVYLLMQLLKNKNHLHLSGDFNQTIRPTFFHPGRIESLLKTANYHHAFEQHVLQRNYRSSKSIVDLANHVVDLRISCLKRYKDNDYYEEAMKEIESPLFLLSPTASNIEAILKTGLKRHYVGIVTASETSKNWVDQFIRANGALFTVEEIKGIEKDYIICYNILSDFYDMWQTVFSKGPHESASFRYIFNLLYVALTRARVHLCFIEEQLPPAIYEALAPHFTVIEQYDDVSLHLNVKSTFDQFFQEAQRLERRELYEQAIASYRQCEQLDSEAHIARCEALMLVREGKTYEAATLFLAHQEYELALPLLRRQKRYLTCLEAMLRADRTYEEIQDVFAEEDIVLLDFVQQHLKQFSEKEAFENCYLAYIKRITAQAHELQQLV